MQKTEESAESFVLITSVVGSCARSSSPLEVACPESLSAGRGVSDLDLVRLSLAALWSRLYHTAMI